MFDQGPSRRAKRIARLSAVLVLVTGGGYAYHKVSEHLNPDGQTKVVATPVTVESMRAISRFVAAEATYKTTMDVRKTNRFAPEFLINRTAKFEAVGTVTATVEFTGLASDDLKVDPVGHTVAIHLPAPQQSRAVLDLEQSKMLDQGRGLATRVLDAFGDAPDFQRQVFVEATDRLTQMARESHLNAEAENSTRGMLATLMQRLGYTLTSVEFDEDEG